MLANAVAEGSRTVAVALGEGGGGGGSFFLLRTISNLISGIRLEVTAKKCRPKLVIRFFF